MMTCPLPLDRYPRILLAHGGGGKLMGQLLKEVFEAAFGPGAGHDSALFPSPDGALAFTTDSYVIHPLIFPGGDIGALSVYGAVNDLAMAGARPLYLSAGFILEEGLSIATLWQIVQSMQSAAQACGVKILTGDTKVVERGKGDGIFINTAGIGVVPRGLRIHPDQAREGDQVLISGDLGRHGMALMATREGLDLETPLESDLAPLHTLVADLLQAGITPHCLRDLTRGGLASALNEIAETAGVKIAIEAERISVCEAVEGACELLGLDPLYVANEGRCLMIVSPQESEKALRVLRNHHPQAARVGAVTGRSEQKRGLVTVKRGGVSRLLDLLSGEQLPRIC